MKWRDLLRLPEYISDLETTSIALRTKVVSQHESIEKMQEQFRLMQDEVNLLKKSQTTVPVENEISKEGPEEVDLTAQDDYRVPMMDGMNLQFEGEDKVIPLTIYGPNSNQTAI